MPETAIICSRTEIDRATWAVLKFGPTGSEKVYLAEISTENNIEKISFENFVLYSDRVAYTTKKNFKIDIANQTIFGYNKGIKGTQKEI